MEQNAKIGDPEQSAMNSELKQSDISNGIETNWQSVDDTLHNGTELTIFAEGYNVQQNCVPEVAVCTNEVADGSYSRSTQEENVLHPKSQQSSDPLGKEDYYDAQEEYLTSGEEYAGKKKVQN